MSLYVSLDDCKYDVFRLASQSALRTKVFKCSRYSAGCFRPFPQFEIVLINSLEGPHLNTQSGRKVMLSTSFLVLSFVGAL